MTMSERTLSVVNVLTMVGVEVDESQAEKLIAAFETLLAGGLPDGLLETQLLGDGHGHWAIHSLWRDRAALDAMRAAPAPPAAPACFGVSRPIRYWPSCPFSSTAATSAEQRTTCRRNRVRDC
jgi:quinol monooxygenase YgiN